jgi:MinD-like ATPase involved in chromosome partitioning or flagellar assembly/stress-induced morphogen
MQENWQISLKQKLVEEYVKNQQEWVDVNISTSGLLNLTIISDRFTNLSLPQRKEQIINFLQSQLPHLSPGFLSLYTLQEAESLKISPPDYSYTSTVYTWQDLAIQAANPQNQPHKITKEPTSPRTVTFYSFKGGVGRTTALTHVAYILAMRGRKVVTVDLDLEAPGLSTAFNLKPQPKYGIVDYFYERSYLPEGVEPSISITQIFGEVRIPKATGRLFVVPAGSLSLDYISKVDDIRATTIIDREDNLWSIFKRDIYQQLKPDIILVDSRTGINQWGALSLLQAADEVIIVLFPNEQNKQGIKLLIQSLQTIKDLSINFVFSPVPDVTQNGLEKVKAVLKELLKSIKNLIDENSETTDEDESELDYDQNDEELLVIPYAIPIALADNHPLIDLLSYYNKIANIIDEKTEDIKRISILNSIDQRWEIIRSLDFPEVNAAEDKHENLNRLFQRTTDFERFLDDTTCLIRGRKGTGKTALYWLLLKYNDDAKQLAHGFLDKTVCISGHGRFQEICPSRPEFQAIHENLQTNNGSWEAFWRSYLLFRCYQENLFEFPVSEKFSTIREIIHNLPKEKWQYESTQALLELSNNSHLQLISIDLLDIINQEINNKSENLWFLYDDLDEDIPPDGDLRKKALSGLFQLVQSCETKKFTAIRFKIFMREDIWQELNFDNKSHFTGKDIILQWARIDFLRLALRQSMQSPDFKNLVERFSTITLDSINQASEESIEKALELLWGNRRRSGKKAKYVSRWVYERLTDSSGTTFPRSLSILLKGAKEQELSYEGQSSIQAPTDRLLRSKSLETGLIKASQKRCQDIREENPNLTKFFDSLKDKSAFLVREKLQEIWQESAQDLINDFDDFIEFLSDIGLIEWREREKRYKFSDIYVYGFEMNRQGAM